MKAEQYTWGSQEIQRKELIGGAPSSDASPFGAWGAHAASSAESDDLTSMQLRTEQHMQKVKDVERRILSKVEETRQVGTSTLSQLHTQREQLGRVAAAQEEIQANLAASDRLLRGMESWRGAFVNTVAGWFSAADTPRAASGRPESSGESAAQAAEARAGVGGAAGSRGAAAAQADPAATDGVGQISSVVADLRAQANQMNAQLRGGRSGPGATARRPGLGLASSQLVVVARRGRPPFFATLFAHQAELRGQSNMLDGLSDAAGRNAAGQLVESAVCPATAPCGAPGRLWARPLPSTLVLVGAAWKLAVASAVRLRQLQRRGLLTFNHQASMKGTAARTRALR